MIPGKAKEILQRLLDKTRAGEVYWQGDDAAGRPSYAEYRVVDSKFQILINRFEISTAIDGIGVSILDSDGRRIARAEVEEGEEGWDLASALYAEAEANVTGWGDKRLEIVEKVIDGPGPIGALGDTSQRHG